MQASWSKQNDYEDNHRYVEYDGATPLFHKRLLSIPYRETLPDKKGFVRVYVALRFIRYHAEWLLSDKMQSK
jgi:hypothetical protein